MFRVVVDGDAAPAHATDAAGRVGVDLVAWEDIDSLTGIAGYLMNPFGTRQPRRVDAELLDEMPDLRAVVYLGQSREPDDYALFAHLAELRHRGIVLATTPAGDAVAEAAIGLIVAADLNLAHLLTDPAAPVGRRGLAGKMLGIVGLGQIGVRVAELGAAFGMQLRYASRRAHPEVENALGVRRRSLDALCAESDFISVHTPNSAPAGLLRSQLLRARGAVLVNTTSCPRVVDPAALVEALEVGSIRRAVVEGRYPPSWQELLTSRGADSFVSLPSYTSWDTPDAREAGWSQGVAAMAAVAAGEAVPHRLV